MAAAHLDAHAATGNIVYEMMAQELMHYAVRMMWDEEGGGFFDRSVPEAAERIGLMGERLKPFVRNCDAARVLKRLAAVKGDHNFGAQAEATLAAMAPLAAQQGPLAAHYLLAAAPAHRLMKQPRATRSDGSRRLRARGRPTRLWSSDRSLSFRTLLSLRGEASAPILLISGLVPTP